MRERLLPVSNLLYRSRITPAYAGKTETIPNSNLSLEDHPRVCGKDNPYGHHLRSKRGSPPRMRERPRDDDNVVFHFGITPAYAGKTPSSLVCVRNM